MNQTYVLLDVELSQGNTNINHITEKDYASSQAVFDSVLEQNCLYIDEGLALGWSSGMAISGRIADSGSGVLLHDSYELGLIWFPKPRYVLSFHEHNGVLFSVSEEEYSSSVHLWPTLITYRTSGIHCISDAAIFRVISLSPEIGIHASHERAVQSTKADIEALYSPLMRG